jgi:hypothetical protein
MGVDGPPVVACPSGRIVKTGVRKGLPYEVTYARPSSYADIIEDRYNLEKWIQRQIIAGLVADESLRSELDGLDAARADDVIRRAKLAAGSALAADRGTLIHSFTEDNDEGRDVVARLESGDTLGMTADQIGSLLNDWRSLIDAADLEVLAVEMLVVNDQHRAAGSLDRIVRLRKSLAFNLDGEVVVLPAGLVVVGDIKTGKMFSVDTRTGEREVTRYGRGYAVQIYLYATGVAYDPDAYARSAMPWVVSDRWALILHLDAAGTMCGVPSPPSLILVDLAAGKVGAELALGARQFAAVAPFSSVQVPVPVEPVSMTPAEVLATMPTAPDEGDDTTGELWDRTWDLMQDAYRALSSDDRAVIGSVITEAQRAGVAFHASAGRTLRRFELYRGLIELAAGNALDTKGDLLRLMVSRILGSDSPLFPAVTVGHAVGSLDAAAAAEFAVLASQIVGRALVVADVNGVERLVAA